MEKNCLVNTNEIFTKLSDICTETKRTLLGKYIKDKKFTVVLKGVIPTYEGKEICDRKFNFTVNGPKCFWCNTFSLLDEEGEVCHAKKIHIRTGSYRDQIISIYQSPIESPDFGNYQPVNFTISSVLNNVSNYRYFQRMINTSCDTSHKFAMAVLVNSMGLPFKTCILGAWLCKNVNIVTIEPNCGSFKDAKFNDKIFKDIFFQIILLSRESAFSHGTPNPNNLFISSLPATYKINDKMTIPLTCRLFLDMGIYSSFKVTYENKNLCFVGKHSPEIVAEPSWNFDFSTDIHSKSVKLTGSPCMKEYMTNRVIKIKLTKDIMEYIRLSGINVFPQIYFFLYLTILLLNKSAMYEYNKSDKITNIIKMILSEEDYKNYMNTIIQKSTATSEDDIVDILIDSNISIRLDLFELIGSSVISLYKV